MAENENEKQPIAESHQKLTITIKRRLLTRRQQTDRNYPTIQTGQEKTIINSNYGKRKTIKTRNYRKRG